MVYRLSQLFLWRKQMENGALTGLQAEESVVAQSEVNISKPAEANRL
jgi:transposase-like protein